MIIYTVLSVTVLYFLFALGGSVIEKVIGRKICAICAAVSLTWFVLLILKLAGAEIDTLVIAILMGQSIVGLMSKLEKYFEREARRGFWLVRIAVIAGGTLFVYWLLTEQYFLLAPLSIIGVLLLSFVLTRNSGGISKKSEGSQEYLGAVSKLETMMEDCC